MAKMEFMNDEFKMVVEGDELLVEKQADAIRKVVEEKIYGIPEILIDVSGIEKVVPHDERKRNTEEQITKTMHVNQDTEYAVVAIYDNAGIPSFMHKFRKTTNKELFGGSDKIHPAFIIGKEEYDEIYISVYENCEINGKPYSLPMQNPWTGITNDEAARACFSKGEGWHLMTRAEWGLLANISLKKGTLPHGNTNYGKYHADQEEQGVSIGVSGKTKTGSGPATWTHDHTVEGVHDLCGNVWEMVRGLRIKDGFLEEAQNNDAAMDIDLTLEGDDWKPVCDNSGKPIRVSVSDGGIKFIVGEDHEKGYDGCRWKDVNIDCESERLKELALYPGEPDAYCYIDSTEGECLPICGGSWNGTSSAGVFLVYLLNPRSGALSDIGFRSAYYRKKKND